MSDVINIFAESGRNVIEDDAVPTFTFENTSSGECLKLQNAGGTGVQLSTVSCPTTSVYVTGASTGVEVLAVGSAGVFKSSASASVPVDIIRSTAVSSPTVAMLRVSTSGASAPALEFRGTCIVSTASAAATYAAGIRVKFGDTYGWIPVLTKMDI